MPRDLSLRVGTRGSGLALAQTRLVVEALARQRPELHLEPVIVQTHGDVDKTSPLTVIGGQGVFTSALQDALRCGQVDAAVHSAKDLPTAQPPDLSLVAFLARDDPRDALVSRHGRPLADLPPNPTIGTSSRRRAAQIRRLRPDARIVDLRGNIDTRLRKALHTDVDGIVLAAAGLARMGWLDRVTELLPLEWCVPSPGQGALAVEIRAGDVGPARYLAEIDEPHVSSAVSVERAFLRAVGGGCTMPVGAYAIVQGDRVRLRAMVANDDGTRAEWADVWFARETAESAAAVLAHSLMQSVAAIHAPTKGLPRSTTPPLAGLAVLVTRAAGDAEGLVAALRTAGAEPVLLPTIQIVDSDDLEALDAAIDRLQAGGYDWVVFTSQHAVKSLVQRLGERGLPPAVMASAQIAAVGSATAAQLDQAGVGVDLVPNQYTADHVLAAMVAHGMTGRRVLFPRGDRARDRLPSGLAAAGATVDEVVVYRTVPASDADPAVLDRLRSGGIDVVTLMSPSSVQSLVSLLEGNVPALTRALVACIGPVTAAAARELGLRVDVVPERSTAEALVEALADHVRMAAEAKGARTAAPVR